MKTIAIMFGMMCACMFGISGAYADNPPMSAYATQTVVIATSGDYWWTNTYDWASTCVVHADGGSGLELECLAGTQDGLWMSCEWGHWDVGTTEPDPRFPDVCSDSDAAHAESVIAASLSSSLRTALKQWSNADMLAAAGTLQPRGGAFAVQVGRMRISCTFGPSGFGYLSECRLSEFMTDVWVDIWICDQGYDLQFGAGMVLCHSA